MDLLHIGEEKQGKRKDKAQRAHSLEPQKHIQLVNLLLWCKIVTVQCFVCPLAL